MTGQLEFNYNTLEKHHYTTGPISFDVFKGGEYAVVSEICHDGYFLGERCYVHEVLPDGYRVEICEGIVWGRPWSKDGTMITVSKMGLSRYYHELHYRQGAYWVPPVEFFTWKPDYVYDTHSPLI